MSIVTVSVLLLIVAVSSFVVGLLVGRKHQKRLNAIEVAARAK